MTDFQRPTATKPKKGSHTQRINPRRGCCRLTRRRSAQPYRRADTAPGHERSFLCLVGVWTFGVFGGLVGALSPILIGKPHKATKLTQLERPNLHSKGR